MGHVLWQQDDEPDGLYIIEAGILRAIYHFSDPARSIEESMVPGTLAGELSALSGLPRNATTVVEQPAVVWRLSIDAMRRMEKEEPELAREFLGLVLKCEWFLRFREGRETDERLQRRKWTMIFYYQLWRRGHENTDRTVA